MSDSDSNPKKKGQHGWPRWLSRELAAEYLGVSTTTFDQEVAAAWWPKPRRRGKKGGRLTWDKAVLDRQSDMLSGLPVGAAPAGDLVSHGYGHGGSKAQERGIDRHRWGTPRGD